MAWCLDALTQAETVGAIIVAAPPDAPSDEIVTHTVTNSPVEVVAGGETRAESVRNALERVDTELVLVHDAARPLLSPSLADSVVRKLLDRPDADGVIAAAPLTDTVKRTRDPREAGDPTIAGTESRGHLWAAQTPQAFRTAKLREAYEADPQRVAAATDEAMLVEKAGGKVLIEPAPASNLKVTTPGDLRIAEILLSRK